ncbi:T-cell-interacting, activating receptor on myeloid cells protein 1-like [Chrysemys picta bellii]|uniref:T-cell-interacting, activating receptor on myeloid cells protein 1-like n=1 Tax=Chrysemys picta bellii TaxID=8478 RepID=UPI0032B2C8FF
MASALTSLFLGCWLAERSRVLGEGSLPKPSISISPSGVIPMGGNVTIRCQHQHLGMRFLLYKAGDGNYLTYTDPAGSEAEFPITSARREHGGSYTCRYSNRTGPAAYSEPSDPVQIIVAGEGPYPAPRLPAPNPARSQEISASPDPAEGTPSWGAGMESLGWSPGLGGCLGLALTGCLLCTDPSLPRPSISLSLTSVTVSGADATIRCQGQRRDVRFFLYKAGDWNPQQQMDPAGGRAEFRIPIVGRQHGGIYSCSYRPQSEPFLSSQPSEPVQLVVAGGTDPTQPGAAPVPTQPASPPGCLDFTHANIDRLALCAVVLFVLGLILAEAYYNRPRGVP